MPTDTCALTGAGTVKTKNAATAKVKESKTAERTAAPSFGRLVRVPRNGSNQA
jgi:hypothetical protein